MAERTVIESGVIRVDASGRRQYSVEFKRRLAKLAASGADRAAAGGVRVYT